MAVINSRVSMKRLTKEYEKLSKSLPKGVSLSLPLDSDIYTWDALVNGPEDSLYKGAKFVLRILASVEYPMKSPTVHFLEPLPYHINVSQKTGQVCLGLLGTGENQWDPSSTIEQILHAIIALLIRPEVSTAMDHETLNEYHHYTGIYNIKAMTSAKKSAAKK